MLDGICDTCLNGQVIDNDQDNDGVCDADETSGCTDPAACNTGDFSDSDNSLCTYADGLCDTCVEGQVIDNDSDDEAAYKAPAYFLEDQSSDLASQIEEEEWEETTNNSLYLAMEGLDERSKDILASRWLSDDKATLHELADKYGISAERVRQLEKNAMNKIKAKMVA